MKLHVTKKGYLRGFHPPSGRQRFEHNVVWEEHHGAIPAGMQVHHKDHDKKNNKIDNLEIMTPLEHKREHSGGRKIDGVWFKICPVCKVEKSVEENYYKRKDGINPECKWCWIKRMVIEKRARKLRRKQEAMKL